MRLDKFLAEAAVGSRKNVRIYIKEGMVKVNKEMVTELQWKLMKTVMSLSILMR